MHCSTHFIGTDMAPGVTFSPHDAHDRHRSLLTQRAAVLNLGFTIWPESAR